MGGCTKRVFNENMGEVLFHIVVVVCVVTSFVFLGFGFCLLFCFLQSIICCIHNQKTSLKKLKIAIYIHEINM